MARRLEGMADVDVVDRELDEQEDLQVGTFQAFLGDRRKLVGALLVFAVLVVAIYVLFPKIVGLEGTLEKVGDATWYWIVVAVGANVAAFAAYVLLFKGVLVGVDDPAMARRLDTRASYQITMAGLAATRIFSAGGAGGIAAHILGGAQGRDAAPARGLPDGGVPGADVLGLPLLDDALRHPAAHQRPARTTTPWAARSSRPPSPPG